ncbi:hypothetical protein L5515_008561 [Caenorhabditis briggsae]|uniref:Uncharacterized protein n=1 Tax=Caenorhabditis briggsae TaxID=6238 RepID=A0AAE9F7J1_CAEBR|nr:hypothetical protein L5515_008561 [Caenorhabditis briggsae]
MLIVSTLFVPFKGAQLFTQYMLAVMTTHSTINCLVMIFTIPEFRAFVMLWSKEGRLQRHRKSLYVMNIWMSVYFFLAIFGCIQSGLTIGISVLQMVRTLHEVKTLISKATWQKHRLAVRNLVLQFQSSLIGIVPAVSIAFVVVIPSKYSQTLSYYFTMIVAVHSTCNAIVMMITYPELRKHAMFWKKPEISTISVSVTQNSSQRVRSIT